MTILTKEQLLATTTKEVELLDIGVVKIRKLKLGEINQASKGNIQEQVFKLLSASLVDPVLDVNEVKNLPANVALMLQEEVMSFNGLSDDAVEEIEKN